ncbi:MAG TPA: EAL domain-containing protein [Xanthobacteraceae bacterium]|nr:EAL domain-containing protein [Xanthobacteraceae bacterium]
MRLHLLELPKLITERRSSAMLGVIIIAMLWAGVALKYVSDRRAGQRDAERTDHNFAMVFEENVLRSIGEIDKALLYLRRSIETRKDSTDYTTIVNTTDVLSEIIVQVAIIDAHGIMRASNAGPQPAPPIDLSDREHFRAHVGRSEDALFISQPMVGRASHKWSVQFSRRFSNRDGSFAGVVVASLDPNYLTKFYDKIDLGSAAAISLIGSDGVVRASGGAAGGFALGEDLRETRLFAHIAAGQNATFADTSGGDGRVVTVRKVRGQPLWVSVSLDNGAIYQSSWAGLRTNGIAAFVLTLIILAAMERIFRTEARARQKAEQLQLTLENISQGIMLVTSDLQVPIINKRCIELLGLPGGLIDKPPHFDELAGHFDDPAGANLVRKPPGGQVGADGRQHTVHERTMPNGAVIEIRTGALAAGGFVQTFTDISKRRKAEAHVARMASEDPLTGLPNRRVFHAELDRITPQDPLADQAEPREFSVMFLDLDRFKVINDTLGHRVGDRLLQAVAKRLSSSLDPDATLARLGGDEFAVVATAVASHGEVEALARRLIEGVSQPYDIDSYRISSSVSIGIAIGPRDGRNADDLLMAADLALNAVKADGRGTYRFYHPAMNTELAERRQIEMDLREAIERNALELHYQPILNLKDNGISGFECLARWRHPTRGMVPPAVFIPIAEDTGLILALGEWALREACRAAAQWPDDLTLSVNLSPVQFSSPNLVEAIAAILAETGLAANRLELEITERIVMEKTGSPPMMLRRLKQLGVRIALDDFGTGFSSLSYLRSFPFDKIKVDRAFISDLNAGAEHLVIVQSVVSIARALGMTTTAEGVEQAAQQEFLAALGCTEAQGYLFSPPVPLDQVPALIARWPRRKTLAGGVAA